MREFNESVLRIIEKFSYDFYIIRQDFSVMCSCVEFSTKEANPECQKCLGTGRKIKIKEIKGASEDKKGSFRNMSLNESSFMRSYFIKGKYMIDEQNIIVDGDEVYVLHRVEEKKTTNREIVYRKAYANKKKAHADIFFRNFQKIIRGDKR